MKQSQKLAVTIVCVTSLTAALAKTPSSDLYVQANDAYTHGDCNTAIELFTRYKAENEEKLKEHVDFLQKINSAINYCKTGSYEKYLQAKNEVIDTLVAKIHTAIEVIGKGASNEEAFALIKQASDLSKEINANDKLDNARSKVNRKLKAAMLYAKDSDLQNAKEELRDAKKDLEALK